MKPKTAIKRAIKHAGSQAALAKACGVTQQAVQQWSASGSVPPHRVRAVVLACDGKITLSDLRPDIFLPEDAAA